MSKFKIALLSLSAALAPLMGLAAEETPKPAQPQPPPVTPPVAPPVTPSVQPAQPAQPTQPTQPVVKQPTQPPPPAQEAMELPPGSVPLRNPAARDTSAAKKLVDEIQSDDAAKSEEGVKTLLKGLDSSITKDKLTYLGKLAVDVNGADKDSRVAAVKKVADVIKTINQSAADALLQIVSAIAAPDPKVDDLDGVGRLAGAINETLKADEINPYIENLASTDPAVVEQSAKKLQDYGADASDLLANAVGDERAPVKKLAADILKKMGPAAKDAASGLAFLLDNDDKVTRHLAASVLDGLGPDMADAADDLINYLDNDDKSVRRVATNLLKKIGPALKDKASDLADKINDQDKNTRALATELLLSLGANAVDAVEPLTGILEDAQGNDADSRKRAARVLGAIGPPAKAALEVLGKSKDDIDLQVKAAVAEAIQRINGEAPVPDPKKVEPEPEIPDEPKPEPLKEAPAADAPKPDAPKVDLPKPDAPKTDAPKVDPKPDAPKADAPKVDPPKTDAPKP